MIVQGLRERDRSAVNRMRANPPARPYGVGSTLKLPAREEYRGTICQSGGQSDGEEAKTQKARSNGKEEGGGF